MPTATRNLTPSAAPPLKNPLTDPGDLFQGLLKDLRIVLGPDNGITASNAVRLKLEDFLQEYQSDEIAWQKYAFRDPTETFTRNLVDRGNGNYNLTSPVSPPAELMAISGPKRSSHGNSLCVALRYKTRPYASDGKHQIPPR
ncbi:MAG: hypothetical protein LQ346_005520 [Caloplaca aetnensis]|nr:MAG: hypothetical protein LQ346_005520 [Caloplaca aetnensis]